MDDNHVIKITEGMLVLDIKSSHPPKFSGLQVSFLPSQIFQYWNGEKVFEQYFFFEAANARRLTRTYHRYASMACDIDHNSHSPLSYLPLNHSNIEQALSEKPLTSCLRG